jgi:citrate synthase
MPLYIGASEAARRLGVRRETLYAYVSRGAIRRRASVDGRRSLYDVDDIDALATRSRRRVAAPRPSLDVQIVSAITELDEHALRFRGRDAAELSRLATFEQVAELLWTGTLPPAAVGWPDARDDDVDACRQAISVLGERAPALARLGAIVAVLGVRHAGDDPFAAARRLIAAVPAVTAAAGGRPSGPIAARLAASWHRRPDAALVQAIDRALVLLADHELATSTLAARLAASVRADAYAAVAAAMATVSGALHGSAAAAAAGLLAAAERGGAAAAIHDVLSAGGRLPGFGHSIYRTGDPRLEPLLDAVRSLPGAARRFSVVADVMRVASEQIVARPNVDFGLAALSHVGGLAPDVPIFAVARIAGWAAHVDEELRERPLRFRGVARAPG